MIAMARRLFILNDAPYGTERATTASAGEVTLIDVRPREEYVAAHIPGAISVPLADLGKCLGDLKKRRDIVAYCRGPCCVMALDAVDLLRRKGFRAHRMEHGVPDWQAQGWRVETGEDRHAGGRP
jgi:rhodanese-related sulfurtransferase